MFLFLFFLGVVGKREGKRSFEFFFSFSRSPRVLSLYPCVASRRAIFDPFPSEFRSPLLTGAFPTPCLPLDRGNQSRSEPSGGEKQGAATARSRIVVAADRGVIARGLGERSWSGGTPGATRRRRRRRRSARGLCFHWEMRVRRGGEEGGSKQSGEKEGVVIEKNGKKSCSFLCLQITIQALTALRDDRALVFMRA